MGRLIYSILTSVDGFIEDPSGSFAWAAPDEEVHAFINDLARPVGLHLYGRRMYEVMRAWETIGEEGAGTIEPPVILDFAGIWRAAEKIVYSTTLAAASTSRTRLERRFEAGAVEALKRNSETDLMIGGPGLAGEALRAGLLDEVHLFVVPTVVGGGKPALPGGVRVELTLEATRRFDNGIIHLGYTVPRALP